MERTFCLVKPDGVQRGIVGEVLRRFESRGLKLVGLKMVHISRAIAEEYYAEHRGKPFFPGLVDYVTSGPAVAMLWEGENAVVVVRKTMGATDPAKAEPGTIRADFGLTISRNVVHGSDSIESANREAALFFKPDEILAYDRAHDAWIQG
ncbi:MAG: nucleoside-diphosphate kinase [Methanobacteriota archaeon]|nr:MAG: nucleoside-diphosphate kinase [Euryarchaeota archaeon]